MHQNAANCIAVTSEESAACWSMRSLQSDLSVTVGRGTGVVIRIRDYLSALAWVRVRQTMLESFAA